MLLYPWQVNELSDTIKLHEGWRSEPAYDILWSQPALLTSLNEQEIEILRGANPADLGHIFFRDLAHCDIKIEDGQERDDAVAGTSKGKRKEFTTGQTRGKMQAWIAHQALGRALLYLAEALDSAVLITHYDPSKPTILSDLWGSSSSAVTVLKLAKKAADGPLKNKDQIRLFMCATTHQCPGRSFNAGSNYLSHVAVIGANGEREKPSDLPERRIGNSHLAATFKSFLQLPPTLILRAHIATWTFTQLSPAENKTKPTYYFRRTVSVPRLGGSSRSDQE